MKKVISAVILASLAGCVPTENTVTQHPSFGGWKMSYSKDRLTDKETISATKTVFNVKAASRLNGANIAIVSISCTMSMVMFGGVVGAAGNTVVSIRADQKPARSDVFEMFGAFDAIAANGTKAKAFLEYIKDAQNLYIQVSNMGLGVTAVDINLEGFRQTAQVGGMACL